MIKFAKLGVIHEENPQGFKLGQVQAPVVIPKQFNCTDAGPIPAIPILMQGQSPECGGYSLATLISILKTLTTALSGCFDYAFEKTVDGEPNIEGTTISAIGKAGAVGSCLCPLFPDDGVIMQQESNNTTPFTDASAAAKADALTRAIGTPFLLEDLSFEGIAQAICQNGAVILEVQVGTEWWTLPNGTESWAPQVACPVQPPKTAIDSHFICAAAYDLTNNRIWFANTWSTEWGQNGWGYLSPAYLPFIFSGIAFKQVPNSVISALTQGQQTLAQEIIADMEELVKYLELELGAKAKVGATLSSIKA
jgi:hypothetical protein